MSSRTGNAAKRGIRSNHKIGFGSEIEIVHWDDGSAEFRVKGPIYFEFTLYDPRAVQEIARVLSMSKEELLNG